MPDSIDRTVKIPVSPFFLWIITALCLTLAGCSSTRVIELEPEKPVLDDASEVAPEVAPEVAMEKEIENGLSATPYSERIAGTVSELYGERGELEQSPSYHDAVADNPLLRYVIIYFDFNSVSIGAESQEVLLEHANYLMQRGDVAIGLEGHADKRGSSGYNLSLGERRALAVQSFLQEHNVRKPQMSAISYGEERPAVEGNDESAYSKNRRVELIYR